MRYALSILLLPALLPLAAAQDNDAEKLFRAMEKKIKAANAFQVAFDIEWAQIGDEKNKGKLNGSLLLTKDNKARLKISGDFGRGEKRTEELVSDGKQIKTTMALKSDWQTSKKFHGLLCTQVNHAGVWLSHLGMPHILPVQEEVDPEMLFHVYDFKIGAAEKVGERDAKAVRYKLAKGGEGPPKQGPDDGEFTLWIDSKTLLPLKRAFVMKRGDGVRITEIYTEFKLDPKVDGKAFELPR